MDLFMPQSEFPLRRHQLVRVFPVAWDAMLAARPDLSNEPLLVGWADRGWPLIMRRPFLGEKNGVPLGLPLPPSSGKRRVAIHVKADDVASWSPLPTLAESIEIAPHAWRPHLQQLITLAYQYAVQVRVFGSLAWQRMTSLTYLSADSDLDLVWTFPSRDRLEKFLTELAGIESRAPMQMDGELVREDGAGVNWRELHSGAAEVVVKSTNEVVLCSREMFVGASA
jgi:phosphoribosyl-dephospho-CoA transferase